MKVVVTLEVEIEDPTDWVITFGVEGERAIRQDVKKYVEQLAQGGVFGDGEVPAKIRLR